MMGSRLYTIVNMKCVLFGIAIDRAKTQLQENLSYTVQRLPHRDFSILFFILPGIENRKVKCPKDTTCRLERYSIR